MMKLNLLSKSLTLMLTAFFMAFSMAALPVGAKAIISNVVVSGPVCAGGTVTVTFNAMNGNGTPEYFTSSTVFRPYLSAVGGGGSFTTALPTFTVSTLPLSGGANDQQFNGITAQIVIPANMNIAPGEYKIALGSGASTNTTGDIPYVTPNAAISNLFTITAPAAGGTISPASNLICSGDNSGVLTLSGNVGNVLRWEKSTTTGVWTIANNTNTTNTFTSGPITQNTQYRAVVQSGNCVAYSSITTITVRAPLTISAQPISATYCQGQTPPVLTVAATGTNVTYQWYSNSSPRNTGGTPIDKATGTSYQVLPDLSISTRYYYVVVSSLCGQPISTDVATVTAFTQPVIGTQPQSSASYCLNSTATALSVSATGNGTLNYEWYRNATPTTNGATKIATTPTYTPLTTTVGTLYYYVVITGACGSTTSAFAAVKVNPDVVAGAITPGSSSICAGATITVTSNGTPGGNWISNNTAIATVNSSTGLVTGVSAGTATITYTVNGCGGSKSVAAQVTVTPATAITTQPASVGSFCANSTATALTVEATGTGTLSYQWYSSTGGTNGEAISGATAASYTPSTTIEGTQYYYVTVTGCNTVTSSVVTVKVGAQNTWNGSSWSAGTSNMPGYNAVIDADYNTTAGNIVACNCTVNSGKTLTIGAGTHMTVENKVVNNGSLIVESDGNLLQKDATVVNGTSITVKRNFTLTEGRKEYNFISSPVKGQNMKLIFGSATAIPYVTVYNEATDYFVNAKDADYNIVGRGFSVKEPTKAAVPLNTATATYYGLPNNGPYSVTLPFSGQYYGFNVVGNPYPSNIDLAKLYTKNTGKIDATFRFWDNTVNNIYTQQGSDYGQSAYATYNALGGSVPAPGYNGKSIKTPTNIVKVDQAFMIQALQAGQLDFDNTMRTVDNNSTFFGKQVNLNAFNLELITPAGIGMQNAFVYSPEVGSAGFGREDSEVYDYYTSDALYSILGDVHVLIDGRGVFTTEDVISLGTAHYSKGAYSIKAIGLQGIFANGQAIYLKDKVTKVITDISKKAYTFEASEGESNNRFEILYRTESLGTDNVVKSGLVVYKEGSSFIVRGGKKMRSVELYDAVGRLVKALPTNSDTMEIAAESMTPGIYVVKVKYDDGTTQTKKVLK